MANKRETTSRKKRTPAATPRPPSRRHKLTDAEYESSFLTAAEAQGVAAYVILHALLRRIPRSMCKSVMAQSYYECDSLGDPVVTEEVETFFWNIDFGDQASNRAARKK